MADTARLAVPDAAAREAALDLSRHVLAIAPAGSGKTTLLIQRALACLAVSDEPEDVLAITFTNKAAAEIRARLAGALAQASADVAPRDEAQARTLRLARAALRRSEERGWNLLSNPGRLRAWTIDSLNAHFAAQLPLLSGLGGPAAIEELPEALYERAIESLFEELEDAKLSAEDRAALEALLRLGDNRVDRLLEPLGDLLARREQWLPLLRENLDAAGDEAVLRRLIETHLAALGDRLGADVCERLAAIACDGGAQSDKLAWAKSLSGWPAVRAEQIATWRSLAQLLLTGDALRKTVDVRAGFVAKAPYTAGMKALLKELGERSDAAALAAEAHAVTTLPDARYPAHLLDLRRHLGRALTRLAAHLRLAFAESGGADFTEVALAALRALSGAGGYSDALARADVNVRHLLVDEMQDTSEAQVELLRRLTSGWTPGDGHTLFMVGDPQQSIYGFRKAEVRLFIEMLEQDRLGDLPLECVRLTANFRSRPALVRWFNDTLAGVFPEAPDIEAGAVLYSPCIATRGEAHDSGIAIHAFDGDAAEAEAASAAEVAQRLFAASGGSESVAALGRTRAHLYATIRRLRALGVPHACQDIDPLAQAPAVRDYVHLARALWHPVERLSWAVLLRSPLVGLSWADMVALSRGRVRLPWPQRIEAALSEDVLSDEGRVRLQRLQAVLARIENDPSLRGFWPARAEAAWHALGGPGCVTAGGLADVRAAMRCVRRVAADGAPESPAALARVLEALFAAPSAGHVQVMTVHKAKGLEFDHVLLVGCGRKARGDDKPLLHFRGFSDGLLLVPKPPESLPKDDPANALFDFAHALQARARHYETQRLLYVAATRAKNGLHLFVNARRDRNGDYRAQSGSFAELLWPRLASAFSQLESAAAPGESGWIVPVAPRLPLDWRYEIEPGLYRPTERRQLKPSEAALMVEETAKTRDDDLYAQLVGTMYHEAMVKVAEEGMAAWADAGAARADALASGFRRLGLAEPGVPDAVARVVELVRRTLQSEDGRWVVSPRRWARNEYHLAGYRDGRWVAAVMDRCFEDDDGTLWVIDYKATARPVPEAEIERYLADAAARYAPQLALYAELLSKRMDKRPVRTALFFPEAGRLRRFPPLPNPSPARGEGL